MSLKEIQDMREKRVALWEQAKAFVNSHKDKDGTLSEEDNAVYEKMEADVVRMGKEVERMERQEAIDMELNRATTRPLTDKPNTADATKPEKKGRASDAYNGAFWRAMRAKSVPIEVMNALQVGEDSEGGYLVPDEFEKTLVEALEEQNIIRSLAHVISTSSDRKIPIVATKGTAQWIEEEAAYPESDDSFGQISIGAYKFGCLVKISEELLNDSVFDMPTYIAREFARRIGAAEEDAFINGEGTTKPTGLLADTGGAKVGVNAKKADSFTFDEVLDLYYSLRAPYRRNAVFLMADDALKTLRKLKNGNGEYLWQPSAIAGTPDRLLDRPIYTSAYMPKLAAEKKTVIFGDLNYYWIADREARTLKRLNELYAANGQVGFLSSERVDGKLILDEAVMCLKQAST